MNKETHDILDFWPIEKYTPRPSQIQALKWLEEQQVKYLFLNAPVGFGKSLVGLTYSRWLNGNKGDSFILTPQKILQKQYEDEVIDDKNTLFSIYGKSNYKCSKFGVSCEVGSLLKKCGGNCEYTTAIKNSISSNNLILNYTLGFLMFGFTSVYDQRKLMICDEAHNLESMLVNFNLLSVTRKHTDEHKIEFKKFTDIHKAFKWVSETYLPSVMEDFEDLSEDVKDLIDNIGDSTSKSELALVRKHARLLSHITIINEFISFKKDTYHEDFVMLSDNFKLEFKPVYGKDNFHDMLSNKAEKFLFMSGTILNKKQLCSDLGISEKETAFLSLDSEFDKDNRPVAFFPTMKMNAKWNNDENLAGRVQYTKTLDAILDNHIGEKGIIHSGNYKIAEYLVGHLQDRKDFKIYHHNPESGNERNEVIAQFTRDTKPSILISPSITEGLDLKNDKGRFAIIGKVPFGYLGDAWIKKRLDLSSEWYACQAAKDIIQGCGRIVRSENDHGTVYIIDSSWDYFYYKNSHLFPKWWKEAYIKM